MSVVMTPKSVKRNSYLKVTQKFPFCKGCGHHHITKAIDGALVRLDLDPRNINITSDIGCVGLVDSLFQDVHSLHTTHGRSTAFATGVEIADSILGDSKLKSLVVIGDGGAMIGLLHLVNAAQLNVDVTVILYNNFLFGMTGGQNSSFSPLGFVTATTPGGNIVPPVNIIDVLKGANAGFLARKTATDADLAEIIADAISYPGFALVEVLELCTEYALRGNVIRGNKLAELGAGPTADLGIIVNRHDRKELGVVYKEKLKVQKEETKGVGIEPRYENALEKKTGFIIAGTAGERVQSAAYMLVQAAVLSGANATQKNDNPVTQGTGFSTAEVVLSREKILYTGIDVPDVVVVVSEDGVKDLTAKGVFDATNDESLIIADETLVIPSCRGRVLRQPLRRKYLPEGAAFAGILTAVKTTGILPPLAFQDVAVSQKRAEELLSILEHVMGEI